MYTERRYVVYVIEDGVKKYIGRTYIKDHYCYSFSQDLLGALKCTDMEVAGMLRDDFLLKTHEDYDIHIATVRVTYEEILPS